MRINILNPDGTLNDSVPDKYRGLVVKKARDAVVADLEAAGLVVEIEDRDIDLAHSDRSKTPIEPYLADQWFIKMDELAQTAMDAVKDGRVKIIPERYAKGYLDRLSEKRDWPIGRQLWWVHRIPVWWQLVTQEELTQEVAANWRVYLYQSIMAAHLEEAWTSCSKMRTGKRICYQVRPMKGQGGIELLGAR